MELKGAGRTAQCAIGSVGFMVYLGEPLSLGYVFMFMFHLLNCLFVCWHVNATGWFGGTLTGLSGSTLSGLGESGLAHFMANLVARG